MASQPEIDPASSVGHEITIKVTRIGPAGEEIQTKSVRVASSLYTQDALVTACEQFRIQDSPELALYKPHEFLDQAFYLDRRQTLRFYGLVTGDALHLKSKLRRLRVNLLDGSQKVYMIDDSMPVKDLTKIVCEKSTFLFVFSFGTTHVAMARRSNLLTAPSLCYRWH